MHAFQPASTAKSWRKKGRVTRAGDLETESLNRAHPSSRPSWSLCSLLLLEFSVNLVRLLLALEGVIRSLPSEHLQLIIALTLLFPVTFPSSCRIRAETPGRCDFTEGPRGKGGSGRLQEPSNLSCRIYRVGKADGEPGIFTRK